MENPSILSKGNKALRENKFALAVELYLQAMEAAPGLSKLIASNMATVRRKYREQGETLGRKRVAVCGWDLSHNAAGRVYTLTKLYETFADVEIIGAVFSQYGRDIWAPIRGTQIPVHHFTVQQEGLFLRQALELVAAYPYDVVHLSKPRAPTLFIGALYKLIWDARVIIDIDDEELSFVNSPEPISLEDYLKSQGRLPSLRNLDGADWTRIAVGLVREFDGITVSNPTLQKKYGGQIVRHARDEKLFTPSPERKSKSRQALGIPQDKKVVLFFGTPRAHKGLLEVADAIRSLQRKDMVFAIVGDFQELSIKEQLLKKDGVDYVFLGNQPFDKIPDIVAAGDYCVLLQDPASPVSQFQVPAKLSDAMGMGLVVLATDVPPLSDMAAQGSLVTVTREGLSKALADIIKDPATERKISQAALAAFKAEMSFVANAPKLKAVSLGTAPLAHAQNPAQRFAKLFEGSQLPLLAGLCGWSAQHVAAPAGRVDVVLPDKPGQNPDLFVLRTAQNNPGLAVIAWVESTQQFEFVQSVQKDLHQSHDLIVMFPLDRLPEANFANPYEQCSRLFALGYSSKSGDAAAFARVLNAGILSNYQSILWIDCNGDLPNVKPIVEAVDGLQQRANSDVGSVSSEVRPLSALDSERTSSLVGTWLPRLARPKPAPTTLVPTGTVVLFRALIAKQMFALTINPQDLEIAQADARRALLAIIGIFANEGQFSVLDFATASGQFAKTGLEDVSPSRTVKTIAFFLPQFHTIPENDLWWGKGFSEWHNVVRARPLFRGHYQPRIPADLGFYDLRSQTTQIAQARLASDHGVHGFCYYYYWFSGKKLLNEPIEQMLKSGKPDFPFCVCWANENWSRNWDGQHRHVLMEQDYSTESNRALIHEFIEMMKDERYIRHHGKPLLLVYRIKIIPNWLETAAMWRAECRKAGLGEIHLCSIRFGLEPLEGPPPLHGLDSYVLFPPQDMKFVDVRHSVHDLNGQFGGSIFSYDAVVDGDVERFRAGYPWPVHRGAMLGWDNTARRLTDARIFVGCTPMRYRAWLKNILEQESRYNKDDESLLFINAWNEWAEGTTLEPDQRYGTSYLEATQSALARYRVPSASAALEHSRKPALLPAPPPAAPVKHAAVLKDPKLTLWFAGRAQYKPGAPTILLCAHISGHQLFGGERSFLDVLGALSRMDVNVVVTVPSSNNKQYIGLLGDLSLGVYAFHYPQWVSDRDPDPSLTLLFSDIIAAHNVSLVYANTIVLIEPEIAAQRMGRLSAVHARELITVDDALRERIGLPVQTIIKTVFARTDFIVANSRATDRIFAREDRTYYVPNAVDANELNLENKIGEKVRIGIVSSNIPKKGVADFVAVAKACEDIAHLADFVVIGPDNAQIETWKKDVVEGRLPKNLKFLGYRETPRQAIAELNVLLNLSWFAESFGRTVAEAMAARRPVIAYEWGALPELVQHGKTGFMAPFGETEKIAGYVRQLCQDKALIQRMGEAGLAFIKDGFSHEALYQHLHRAMGKIRQSPQWQRLQAAEVKNSAQNPVTVVIPVYNAPAEVENCIQSVIKHTPLDQVEVLVINDGSSDKQIPGVLKKFEGVKGLRILHNETNIGYTKTVNKGIKEAGQCDVILLNSDAVVTPAWLAGMRASAYAEQNIGTVTAMSDNAGAFSFPVQGINNPKPDYLSHDEYAMRVVDATLHCRFVDVPTGSGFCMYIRRDMMNQIGLFDEEAFPRGYGEENDFCMRALAAGWRNIITPWAFIYHIRTASFKGEKEALVQAGVNVVTRKYPEYSKKVKEAWQGQAMAALRKASALPI